MKYIVDHIPKTSKKRPGYKLVPEYLTIHSTGNSKSTARNERDYLTNPHNTSSTGWHNGLHMQLLLYGFNERFDIQAPTIQ